jgi:UV DNA damage endonuclease
VIRLGLCCIFVEAPIRFRRTTATYQSKLGRNDQLRNLAALCLHNAKELHKALSYCRDTGIGAFRINSQILPLITHPQHGYSMQELPGGDDIVDAFRQCGDFSRRHDIRTSFHPDQFVVIASPRPDVRKKSVKELLYQAMVAEWVGADVINIHAGGAYGNKTASLKRLVKVIKSLPDSVRSRLTLENDDRIFSPADLLPGCRESVVPMVYDVHHHRCLPDALSVDEATQLAIETWNREPLFHISSPLDRERIPTDRRHADTIDVRDFPVAWRSLDITVDVEAKAKEVAVEKLRSDLEF